MLGNAIPSICYMLKEKKSKHFQLQINKSYYTKYFQRYSLCPKIYDVFLLLDILFDFLYKFIFLYK